MAWPTLPKRVHASLRALCCLGVADKVVQAPEIAACADLPTAETAKLLQMLIWAGFVDSRRGTKGGYWLRMRPEQILVQDVIAFFDSRAEAQENPGHTDVVLRALRESAAECQQTFGRLTVADLIHRDGGQCRQALKSKRSAS